MDHHYDIAIIGLGCAGSHLVHALLDRLPNIRLVVIDGNTELLEKKWSFWEKKSGNWDHLIKHQWRHGIFKYQDQIINLDLRPYYYKTIDSIDFINHAKQRLLQHKQCKFVNAQVYTTNYESNNSHLILHTLGKVNAHLILDSRIDKDFYNNTQAVSIHQHFRGWTITTDIDSFDPNKFIMMDYSIRDKDTTSFTYVLPYSRRKALIEFTYFTPSTVDIDVYDQFIDNYITDYLKIKDYTIIAIEQGDIPMTKYDFNQHHTESHVKIGTAGGWVKPSTGYSFKMSEKKARQLVDNYINHKPLTDCLFSKRARIMDHTMLDILYNYNIDGPDFFNKLYKNIKIPNLFKFLDEETTIIEEVIIMRRMSSLRMIKAFIKNLF